MKGGGHSGASQPWANIYHSLATWLHKSFTLSEIGSLTYKMELKCLPHTGKLQGIREHGGERHLLNILTLSTKQRI